MDVLPYFFPLFFALMAVAAMYFISQRGWADLASVYRYEAIGEMRRFGIVSIAVNGMNYNNCLTLSYNQEGMYLKPIIFFRLFHPPIFIPWSDIVDLGEKKILFQHFRKWQVGQPVVAILLLRKSVAEQLPMRK